MGRKVLHGMRYSHLASEQLHSFSTSFAEAFHWILVSYLGWEFLEHYLDDNMAAIKAIEATPDLTRPHIAGIQISVHGSWHFMQRQER